jgi:hypothetical protein
LELRERVAALERELRQPNQAPARIETPGRAPAKKIPKGRPAGKGVPRKSKRRPPP